MLYIGLRRLEIYRCHILFVRVTSTQKTRYQKCLQCSMLCALTTHQKQSCVLYAITNALQYSDRLNVHYKLILTVSPRESETGRIKLWSMIVSDLGEAPSAPLPTSKPPLSSLISGDVFRLFSGKSLSSPPPHPTPTTTSNLQRAWTCPFTTSVTER